MHPSMRLKFAAAAVAVASVVGPMATGPAGADTGSPCLTVAEPNVTLTSQYDASVYRLYCAYFLRLPDQGGFDYWHGLNADMRDITNSFVVSAEFVQTYGALDDTGFVDLVYKNVLERPRDGAGFDYWVDQITSGMSRGDLMIYFSDSAEFKAKVQTPITEPVEETLSQKNAVAKAKSYLKYSAFSEAGLIAQLEYSKFSTADATYAVKSLNVDWRAQAVEKAKSYLKVSAFSESGLISQLEYSKFSTADATYAVKSLNVDWNAQAAAKAASYLEVSAFSRQGLIDQLEYSGFTTAQAEFGVAAVGY